MGYAFISYSSKNQSTADAFRALLQKNNVNIWMAPYDIPAGSEYAEVLYGALVGCSCLVLLLTEESQSSPWVKKEVNIAVSNCKMVIPVKLEDIELNSTMKLYLNDQQMVLIRTLDENSDGISKLLKNIIAITGQAPVPSSPPASTPQKAAQQVRQVSSSGVYEGDFVDGQRTGKGKYTWNDGSFYEGDYVNGNRTGKGKYVWPSGTVYEGDFVDNKRTGKGKYTWNDGSFYEGDYVNGNRTGKGKYVWPSGTVYEGDFVDNMRTGKGKCTWNDGSFYEGDYVNGNRTGKGKYVWPNGTVYEGDFVDNKRTGEGKLTKKDGTIQQGRFEDGEFLG